MTIKHKLYLVWVLMLLPFLLSPIAGPVSSLVPLAVIIFVSLAVGKGDSFKESILEKNGVVGFVVLVSVLNILLTTGIIGSIDDISAAFEIMYLNLFLVIPLMVVYFLRFLYQYLINSKTHVAFKVAFVVCSITALLLIFMNFGGRSVLYPFYSLMVWTQVGSYAYYLLPGIYQFLFEHPLLRYVFVVAQTLVSYFAIALIIRLFTGKKESENISTISSVPPTPTV